jgi:hypothetical protein
MIKSVLSGALIVPERWENARRNQGNRRREEFVQRAAQI